MQSNYSIVSKENALSLTGFINIRLVNPKEKRERLDMNPFPRETTLSYFVRTQFEIKIEPKVSGKQVTHYIGSSGLFTRHWSLEKFTEPSIAGATLSSCADAAGTTSGSATYVLKHS